MSDNRNKIILKNPDKFAIAFFDNYIKQGFQSLSKRDIDSLIFYLFENNDEDNTYRKLSNYELAQKLRIPISKVKSLRKDAYARWQESYNEENLSKQITDILQDILQLDKIDRGRKNMSNQKSPDDGYFAVTIEHPYDREVFEQALREIDARPIYERNREVILVNIESVVQIANKYKILSKQANKDYTKLQKVKSINDILSQNIETINFRDSKDLLCDNCMKLCKGEWKTQMLIPLTATIILAGINSVKKKISTL